MVVCLVYIGYIGGIVDCRCLNEILTTGRVIPLVT